MIFIRLVRVPCLVNKNLSNGKLKRCYWQWNVTVAFSINWCSIDVCGPLYRTSFCGLWTLVNFCSKFDLRRSESQARDWLTGQRPAKSAASLESRIIRAEIVWSGRQRIIIDSHGLFSNWDHALQVSVTSACQLPYVPPDPRVFYTDLVSLNFAPGVMSTFTDICKLFLQICRAEQWH